MKEALQRTRSIEGTGKVLCLLCQRPQTGTKGHSISDKYKILLFVIGGSEGTAFGGGIDDKVGALWTPATRVNKAPYGALAHELGHSFQFLARIDNGRGPRGAIMEMSAQYMLWQVYPGWMTFENNLSHPCNPPAKDGIR
ncbi:DUF6055 domain-containing protein [Paraflavitalea speifideaquila]|uniref:DUF6055 domain-containing protein n=1 Tax=Paraflavitalea speifideaquila TaxID=3076558 RepID=UPI0028E8A85A|nr:DUF6055 domain-containing protein [Paraflavitalea speifideiaquila]